MALDWSSLPASRSAAQRCKDDISALKETCAASHPSADHIVQCPDCYPLLVDRLRERFFPPSSSSTPPLSSPPASPSTQKPQPAAHEWFSSRPSFLADLDALFARVRAYDGVDLAALDARIATERRLWYLERVRATPAVRRALEDLLGRRDLVRRAALAGSELEDADGDSDAAAFFGELVGDIRAALRGGDGGERAAAPFLERLGATQPGDRAARAEILKEALFVEDGGEVPERAAAYLDVLMNGDKDLSSALDDLVNRVLSDRQAAVGVRDRKERHERRLDELRRARTAHEAEKARKKAAAGGHTGGSNGSITANGTVGGAAGAHHHPPPDWMYEMAPCDACGRTPTTGDFVVCGVCLVLVGLRVREQKTMYCSVACKDRGLESHIKAAHKCTSGDSCIQLQAAQPGSAASHAPNSGHSSSSRTTANGPVSTTAPPSPEPYLCRTCVKDPRRAGSALFCSLQCAEANFRAHRERAHTPEEQRQPLRRSSGSSTTTNGEVKKEEGSEDAAGAAAAAAGAREAENRAAEVRGRVVAVGEAVRQLQARIGVEGAVMKD
ncbi:hypothetical protein NKR23_g1628 [Pleurostoma richardsiae]|uniref:Uncharacterized protein n=1 Tax=Pleurostoma richardsiae TaxID=41990 RepID=A0AA38S3U0_9PEZI|nr:hypothetical protein NKR23_g1628 [Pleurostoma richardsiae]